MAIDISVGMKFGRLEILGIFKKGRSNVCSCLCDCGKTKYIAINSIRKGLTKSCGCLRAEMCAKRHLKHGLDGTKEHKTWVGIKQRCLNKNCRDYKDYGGRGITVCDRWVESFQNFLDDIGKKPSPEYSIERVDVDKGYEPGNVKWIPMNQQALNKRNSVRISWEGKSMRLEEWATEKGLSKFTVRARYYRKGSMPPDLFFPPDKGSARRGKKCQNES